MCRSLLIFLASLVVYIGLMVPHSLCSIPAQIQQHNVSVTINKLLIESRSWDVRDDAADGADGRLFRNDYKYHRAVDGWIKYHVMPETWSNARTHCQLEGSVLASPLNPELLDVMKSVMEQQKNPILTGISASSSGVFHTIEGVPFPDVHHVWAPGQPDNAAGAEQCVLMHPNGSLADVRCDQPRPYMCYKQNSKALPLANECGTVDPEYYLEKRTGHCYKFHKYGQYWAAAQRTCVAEGGHLAIVNSYREADVLKDLIEKHPVSTIKSDTEFIAVGFHDWNHRGLWMTVHGQTLKEAGYEVWLKGEPNNSGNGEYCGSVFRNLELNDFPCELTAAFICEKLPNS